MKLKSYNPRNVWQVSYLPHTIPDGMIWDKISSRSEDVQSILRQGREIGRLRSTDEILQLQVGDIVIIEDSLWQLCENCHEDYYMHTGVNMNYCDWDRKKIVVVQ